MNKKQNIILSFLTLLTFGTMCCVVAAQEAEKTETGSAVTSEEQKSPNSDGTTQRLNSNATASDPLQTYYSGVLGGAHDFSDRMAGSGDACKACHVPHINALRPKIADLNKDADAKAAPEPNFEMFRIPGQRRIFAPDAYTPGPSSLVCMGCHDGTVATSTFGSSHAMLAGVREGFQVPDDFVWRDHPIGVKYPAANRDYHPTSHVEARGIPLPDGRIECISCHDPHNRAGLPAMLATENRRSALCLTCHKK